MENAPVPVTQQAIATANALQLPHTTAELSSKQLGWLGFCAQREALAPTLQKGELFIQAKVQAILATKDLPTIQAGLKEIKAQYAADQEQRKAFTSLFESKVAQPLMAFEKRNEELIKTASSHELATRTAAAAEATKIQAKETEKAQLRAHITSEYYRCAALYRQNLDATVTAAYTTSLETGFLEPFANVIPRLVAEPQPQMVTRPLVNITVEEANEIFFSIPAYDRNAIVTETVNAMQLKWNNFEHDLHNAPSAIAAENIALQEKAEEVHQDIVVETGIQNLQAAAATSIMPIGPKVKKSMEVVVFNTDDWAMAVLSHFMRNWQECRALVRVKTIDKLSVGQMATALGQLASKTGESFKGLELIEAVK